MAMSRKDKKGPDSEAASGDSYEELFAEFSDRAEKWMIRIAKALAVLLVVVQLVLLHPGVRHLLVRVERLEGDPFTNQGNGRP